MQQTVEMSDTSDV